MICQKNNVFEMALGESPHSTPEEKGVKDKKNCIKGGGEREIVFILNEKIAVLVHFIGEPKTLNFHYFVRDHNIEGIIP